MVSNKNIILFHLLMGKKKYFSKINKQTYSPKGGDTMAKKKAAKKTAKRKPAKRKTAKRKTAKRRA
mgnify:CR=1 FL=1